MKWTPDKIEALRRRYPHEDNGRLAREFGCSRKALVFRASHLGLRKTDAANEARYAALSRRIAPERIAGERREIATGTLIVRGNILTHLSRFSASREQPRAEAQDRAPGESTGTADRAAHPQAAVCPLCGSVAAQPAPSAHGQRKRGGAPKPFPL